MVLFLWSLTLTTLSTQSIAFGCLTDARSGKNHNIETNTDTEYRIGASLLETVEMVKWCYRCHFVSWFFWKQTMVQTIVQYLRMPELYL